MPTVRCNSLQNINWSPAPNEWGNLSPEVDIWRIPVSNDPQQLDSLKNILQEEELVKAARYHQEKDRRRFITGRAMLRVILAKYLRLHPRNIQFEIGSNKKPFIKNPVLIDLKYNISHAGNWILFAIGGSELGVDVEKIDQIFFYEEVLPISFSDIEINSIENSSSPRSNFYLYWTRKEALIKATSQGLDDHLTAGPCMDGLHTVSEEIAGGIRSWIINSFPVDNDHIASVSYHPEEKTIRFFDADMSI